MGPPLPPRRRVGLGGACVRPTRRRGGRGYVTGSLNGKMHLAETRAIDVVAKLQQQLRPDKMQLKTILNHVEKQKGFIYASARFDKNTAAILVDIKPHARSRPICSGCDMKRPGYDRLPERRFEFVPLWAIPVYFVYAMRRVSCPDCGVKVERVPWADGKHQSTYSYRIFLARWAT